MRAFPAAAGGRADEEAGLRRAATSGTGVGLHAPPPSDARRLLGQTSEFWDTQALKQECRRKYGSTGPEISAPS